MFSNYDYIYNTFLCILNDYVKLHKMSMMFSYFKKKRKKKAFTLHKYNNDIKKKKKTKNFLESPVEPFG